MIKLIIAYKNRTMKQILSAYLKLKARYKQYTVSYKSKPVGALYSGAFSVLYK